MNILTQIQSLKHTIAHKRAEHKSAAVQEHKLVQLVAKQIRRETREEKSELKTMREIEQKINQLGPIGR